MLNDALARRVGAHRATCFGIRDPGLYRCDKRVFLGQVALDGVLGQGRHGSSLLGRQQFQPFARFRGNVNRGHGAVGHELYP